jgi:pimeloyl-ACP methyl ester carboxylesterase
MPNVRVDDGAEIDYETRGDGEPVLLIMGTGSDRHAWGLQTVEFARRGYAAIAPDNRGVGKTRAPLTPESIAIPRMADDVAAVLDDVGVRRAHVAGMSMGAAIAQEFALRHPDRIATLQLHAGWGRTDAWLSLTGKCFLMALESADDRALAELTALWTCSPALLNDDAEREQWLELRLHAPSAPSREGVKMQWRANLKHDALDRLGAIARPTLVTAGEQDFLIPPRYSRAVAEAIPGARYHGFTGPRASHVACIEMAEEFNRVCLNFMRVNPIE